MKIVKIASGLRVFSVSAAALIFLLGTAVPASSGDDSVNSSWILDDQDLVPLWQRFTFAEAEGQAADDVQARPGGERIKTKSPLAAFLLGGILGFGSGQFYSGKRGSGYFFLGADIILSGVIIGGAAAMNEEKDEGFFGGFEELYAAYIALCVLAGSHAIQAVWGAYSAAEYNKSVSVMPKDSPDALDSREREVLAIRLSWRF